MFDSMYKYIYIYIANHCIYLISIYRWTKQFHWRLASVGQVIMFAFRYVRRPGLKLEVKTRPVVNYII
jgi:hypothetical protein